MDIPHNKKKKAFTLIEIMLVVIIISVLAAMVIPNLAGRGEEAKKSAARADIEANLSTALDMYELDNGHYPTTAEGLKALLNKPEGSSETGKWKGPYFKKKSIPKDPWRREYLYVSPGKHNTENFDLYSLGPDGIESGDDIVNWEEK